MNNNLGMNQQAQLGHIQQQKQKQSNTQQSDKNDNKIADSDCHQYQVYYKYSQQIYHVSRLQMSPNEKYLAYFRDNDQLEILDMAERKIILTKQFMHISFIKFSEDSQRLFVGDFYGILFCFDIRNNIKKIFKIKLQQYYYQMVFINKNLIISFNNQDSLIVTNLQRAKSIQKSNNINLKLISGLEFDRLTNTMVVSSDNLSSIYFFNHLKQEILFQRERAHDQSIDQIQITNGNLNLLSCDNSTLILWQIDYQNKQLYLIKQFEGCKYFTSVKNDSRIITLFSKQIKILDNQFNIIQLLSHDLGYIFMKYYQQCQSLKYIIIAGDKQLIILKKL